jgi:hypothetical protein
MSPGHFDLYISLLATFCSPLLSNHWLMAVTAATASLLLVSAGLRYSLKAGLSSALLIGGMVFAFAPQTPQAGIPGENRASSETTSTGLYGAPGSTTRDIAVDNSRFVGCDSGLENHGAMENIIIRNSSFDCPPKFGVPAAAPKADSSKAGAISEPLELRGTAGIYNSPGAVTLGAAIINFRSVGCADSVEDIPSAAIWVNGLDVEPQHVVLG